MKKVVVVGIILVSVSLIFVSGFSGVREFSSSTKQGTRVGFTFDHYVTYEEMVSTLKAMAAQYSNIMNVSVIGYTYGWNESSGHYDTPREIFLVKISDNPDADEDEPEILIDGLHHAREWLAVEVPLYFIQTLVENYGQNDTITWLVNHREIYVVPMVNPDGYVYDGNGNLNNVQNWRKNCRDNDGDGVFENDWITGIYEGVDLNRNYDIDWENGDSDPNSETYRGPSPFSEPETQAMRDFAYNHTINLYLTYHSYAAEILVPPGYSYDAPRPYDYLEFAIGENMSKLQPYTQYDVIKSTDLYPASGAAEDWFQSVEKAISFTIELEGNDFHPDTSAILPACENNIEAMIYALKVGDMNIRSGFPPKPYIIWGYAAYPNEPVVATNLNNGENVSIMPMSNGFFMLNLGLLQSNYTFSDTIRVSNGNVYLDIHPDANWGKFVDLSQLPEFGIEPLYIVVFLALFLPMAADGKE